MSGGQNVTIKAPKAASIRAMTSAYGRVVPLIWGKNRVQANVMYYTDFTAIEHSSKQSTGGKGGGGSQTSVDYTYTVCALFGLVDSENGACSVGRIWVGKEQGIPSDFDLSFFDGNPSQTAMSYIQTKHPTEAINYRGTAYIGSSEFSLGDDASMPNVNVEVIGRQSDIGTGAWLTGDTNPLLVINDFITSASGLASYGIGLGDTSAITTYCIAAEIFVSPVYTEAKPVREILGNLAKIANCGMFFSGNSIKLVPFGDTAISANTANYNPNLTPVFDLNENDIKLDGEEPVRCVRKAQADAYNYVKLTYQNRANDYNDDMVEAKDQASIERYGIRAMSEVSLPEIADTSVARVVAQNILQRAQNIRNTYEFTVNLRFCILEPMDIVTLTYSGQFLDHEMLRIIEVEELDDGFRIKAEEMQIGAHYAARYTTQTSDGYAVDYNIAPGATTVQAIFEAPTELANTPQVWCAATPAVLGSKVWGGANVWVSTDGSTYKKIGMLSGASRAGKIGSIGMNFMTGSGPTVPDTTSTCRADISYSNSSMDSGNAVDAARYTTLCYANGEFFSYKTSTLVSTGIYDLTYLYRGLYGSIGAAHGANSTPFVRIDDTLFKFDYSGLPDVGNTLYFKFQSFNIYGGGVEDLSGVSAQTLTLSGFTAPPVAGLTLDSQADDESIVIKWNAINTAIYYEVDIRDATGVTSYKTVKCTDTRFIFLWQETANLSGGPYRALRFYVRTYTANGVSAYSFVSVSNPVPAAISGLKLTGGYGVILFQWTPNTEKDLAGYQVWLSNTSGFTPGPTNLLVDQIDNSGNTRQWNNGGTFADLVQGTTYYFRAAAYDRYGKTGLNLTTEVAVTVLTIATGIGPGDITNAMIAAGAVDMAKMATGIRPSRVVTSLPTVDGTIYKNGDTVTLTTDGQLYRAFGGAWVNAVPAVNVTGTLTNSQIADLAATKITGQLVDSQLAAIAAAKLTGQITGTQITNGSISTPKLAAGAVTANEIAADTITAANIAANAITSSELSAGAVIAGKLAAGAVTAGTVAANVITATELNAGAVTTSKLAAGAVTANEIAANTITAAKIAAGAIGATEIAAGAITTDKLYVGSRGAALNANPSCNDATAWTNTGTPYSIVSITDGVSGTGALRSSTARSTSWPTSLTFPITAGKTYRVQAWARGVNASPGNLYLRCVRLNSSGGDVSSGGSVGLENFAVSGSWVQYIGTFVAEATAVVGYLAAPMNWGGTANTAYLEIQDFRCEEFIPGTLIMDGAVTTNKVAANAITAGKIAANTITANEIAANTITAAQILANSIDATRIDSRNLTIKDASGNVIFSAGVPLSSAYADASVANPVSWISGGLMTIKGSTITSGGSWSNLTNYAYAKAGQGGAVVSATATSSSMDSMIGLSQSPTTNTANTYASIDFAVYLQASGNFSVYENGNSVGTYGTYTSSSVISVVYDGAYVKYLCDGSVRYQRTVAQNLLCYGKFASGNGGDVFKNVDAGPLPSTVNYANANGGITITGGALYGIGAGAGTQVDNSNQQWAQVGGSGKPADNATVGAIIGTNLSGQITAANASTFIASAAIGAAQIGSLNASVIVAGTITTDKLQVGSTSTTATIAGANQAFTVTGATSIGQFSNIRTVSSTKAINGSSMYYFVSFKLTLNTSATLANGDYNVNWYIGNSFTDDGAGGSVTNISDVAFAEYSRMRLTSSTTYIRCGSFVACLGNSAQTGTIRLSLASSNIFIETVAGGTYANGINTASLSWYATAMEAKV